jgi:hypothetical protein
MYRIIGGDGQEYGPVSADELRRWIAEGRATAQTRVQVEGSADWQSLGAIPEFAACAMPASPAFQSPATAATPTFIKVFSILNMVFGGLGLLCAPVNFVSIPLALEALGSSPLMKAYLVFSSVWGFIGAVILLATGIGLWKLRAWARKLAVGYSVLAIAIGLVGIAITLATFGAGDGSDMERAQRIGGVVGGVVGGLIGLAYNVLLIVFLTKAAARRATGEIA